MKAPNLADAERKIARLNGLVAAGATINSSLDRRAVLGAVMGQISRLLASEAASIILLDEGTNELFILVSTDIPLDGMSDRDKPHFPKDRGIAGWVVQNGRTLNIPDVTQDPRHFGGVDQKTGFVTRSLLAVPLRMHDRAVGVLEALNRRDGQPFDGEDEALFESFSDQVAVALELAQLHEQALERERMAQELRTARAIQLSLMPQESPAIPGFEIAGTCIPAAEVGGDYFTYLWLDEGRLAFLVADVSGKGMGAATVTMRFNEMLRYEAQGRSAPGEILRGLDGALRGRIGVASFVTGCIGVLDIAGKRVRVSSAAHPMAYHYAAGDGSARQVAPSGLPMGMTLPAGMGGAYPETEVRMEAGDLLVVYSDGIPEAQDGKGEFYEEARVAEAVQGRAGGASAQALMDHLLRDVEAFRGGAPQQDDMTVLVVRCVG